jgi:hypothetical protein
VIISSSFFGWKENWTELTVRNWRMSYEKEEEEIGKRKEKATEDSRCSKKGGEGHLQGKECFRFKGIT